MLEFVKKILGGGNEAQLKKQKKLLVKVKRVLVLCHIREILFHLKIFVVVQEL